MIDAAVLSKLEGQLTALYQIRQLNKRTYFDLYVQPTFETAQLVHDDYCALLKDLRELIRRKRTCQPVIQFLEERRQEVQPARELTRALIMRRVHEGRVSRFEAGVLGLMGGAVTSVSAPYFTAPLYSDSDSTIFLQLGRHTVLDILQKLKRSGSSDLRPVRADLLKAVDEKEEGVEQAWQNVLVGYAELHGATLPPAGIRARRKRGRFRDIESVQSYLAAIHNMIDSEREDQKRPEEAFGFKLAEDFEQTVKRAIPELGQRAEDIRETIHELANKAPNIEVGDLKDRVSEFEDEFEKFVRRGGKGRA
jgi:hypothetical protein